MGKLILYHGTPNEIIQPVFGCGDEKHDYGKGFYLTENVELAKEFVRDILARKKMRELVDSDRNKVIRVFSTLVER